VAIRQAKKALQAVSLWFIVQLYGGEQEQGEKVGKLGQAQPLHQILI
jgi:hypothetical protein